MKRLACKDISPDTTCTFVASGETASDAAKIMLAHARKEHAVDIASMSDAAVIASFEPLAHE